MKRSGAPIFVLLVVLTVLWIFPIYLMFKISISEPQEILTQHPTLIPHSFTIDHWKDVIASGNVIPPLKKSFIVAALTSIIALFLAIPGA